MVKMKEICQKFHNERNYFNQFKYFVNNYENIIEVKKLRNRPKKNIGKKL